VALPLLTPRKTTVVLNHHEQLLVNCSSVIQGLTAAQQQDEEDNYILTNTDTSHPFRMNVHPKGYDVLSDIIRSDPRHCWECEDLAMFEAALAKHTDPYFLDIGGNIGMYSLSMASAGYQTFTLEPFPANYHRICRTVLRNDGFQERVNLLNIAASDHHSTLEFRVASNNNMGSVTAVGSSDGKSKEATIQAKAIPIDSLDVLPRDRPVAIKMDVEGAECLALTGATDFFANAQIVIVLIELRSLKWKSCKAASSIVQSLSAQGLTPYQPGPNGTLVPMDPAAWRHWRHWKHPIVRYFDVIWKK
jgi:FkbM family methyltransferase